MATTLKPRVKKPEERQGGVRGGDGRLRPVDLARRAGVSTQQVRNLEAAGVLPEVARTPSGYRRYGLEHLSALMAYQALAVGHGAPTARTIMWSVNQGRLHSALSLIDASHAALHDQRQALEATSQALSAVASQDLDQTPVPSSGMRIGELANRLGVRPSTLRVWESAGLLTPAREEGTAYRRYTPSDIRDARIIHLLRQGRYLFDRIRPVLEGLRSTGSTDALHAAIEERRAALDARAIAMLDGASRLHQHLNLTGRAAPWGGPST